MKQVERRICDRRVLKLIRKWLSAGVLEKGKVVTTDLGTPQGGVISPLLANIYLHYLDDLWVRRCKEVGVLVRYCDDMVVLCRNESGRRWGEHDTAWLNGLGLIPFRVQWNANGYQ